MYLSPSCEGLKIGLGLPGSLANLSRIPPLEQSRHETVADIGVGRVAAEVVDFARVLIKIK